MDIEMKAIDELIYEVEMFEQAGVYPVQDFIDNLKTLAAQVKEETKLEGCVVVPLENTRYFSNDGENYEIHETLEQAKHEAECAIEHYSERLADQLMDPTSDGNFHQIGYGIILAESTYSIDHVVTQDDIDNDEYSYEVGTQIMTLSLVEAARGGNEH